MMKRTDYTQPAIEIENVMVENGIAVSPNADATFYGFDGDAGQTSGYVDAGFEL